MIGRTTQQTKFQAADLDEALDRVEDWYEEARAKDLVLVKLTLTANPSRGRRVYGYIEWITRAEKQRLKSNRDRARAANAAGGADNDRKES